MKKILTAIFCIAALVFIAGCDFLKKYDQAKVDEFALAFAQKYLFDETKTFNEAYAKCYQSVVTVEYPIPKPEEFSIVLLYRKSRNFLYNKKGASPKADAPKNTAL